MNSNTKGFTLIGMVVVLAIIAILAALLTPVINGYVDRARLNSAHGDVKNIAAAFVQYNTDTKFWPIYTAADQIPSGTTFGWMGTDGDNAQLTGTGWAAVTNTTGSLDVYLNSNFYSLPATGYRAWHGPYMSLNRDPWGSRYYITSAHLAPSSTKAAYVISAGPNQTIETIYSQDRTDTTVFTVGGDDIVMRIK